MIAVEPLEIFANTFNAVSIVAAGRNSIHTWWTGIVGCLLFAWLFADAKLYADSLLQAFFIGASVVGWLQWSERSNRPSRPVRYADRTLLIVCVVGAVTIALGYARLLARFTDAAAPVPDSLVLTLSVLGQLLLMARRVETWWCWIAVNVIAVPLYASRELILTSVLYAGFLVNALVSLWHWRKLAQSPS